MIIDFIIRLFVAAILGTIIGLEREYRAKEAGYRMTVATSTSQEKARWYFQLAGIEEYFDEIWIELFFWYFLIIDYDLSICI